MILCIQVECSSMYLLSWCRRHNPARESPSTHRFGSVTEVVHE